MGKTTKICVLGLFGVVLTVVLWAVWRYEPESARWMPKCWWHAFTGTQCPSCGSTRALHALLHGEWGRAWGYNPALFVSAPLAAAIVWLWVRRPSSVWLVRLSWAYAVLMAVWWVARNL